MTNIEILQIISIIYLLLGLGMILNPKYYLKAFCDLYEDKSNIYLFGFLGLIISYLLINFTGNTTGWFIIIPIFGWIGLIKSIIFFLAPKFLMGFAKMFTKKKEYLMFMAISATTLGIVFGYISFFML